MEVYSALQEDFDALIVRQPEYPLLTLGDEWVRVSLLNLEKRRETLKVNDLMRVLLWVGFLWLEVHCVRLVRGILANCCVV